MKNEEEEKSLECDVSFLSDMSQETLNLRVEE